MRCGQNREADLPAGKPNRTTDPEAVRQIGALYPIEAEIREQLPEIQQRSRQARAASTLEGLYASLGHTLAKLSLKSALAEAIRYARTQSLPLFDQR